MTAHPIDTEALRRLADAATPGPWPLLGGGEYVGGVGLLVAPDDGGVSPANAAFIAAARTAIPALLDENAALRARIKAVEDVLEESEARGPVGMTFNGTPFPAWISIATVRRALTA